MLSVFANSFVPTGHADDANESIITTGYLIRYNYDSFYGQTVDAVEAGTTLTFTVAFTADNFRNYQRNITMGVKFDWMSTFQNTSASIPVQVGQTGFVTRQFTIPALTGQYASLNLIPHTWTVEVWDMAIGAVWTTGCNSDDGISSCRQFNNSNQLAVYSSTQATGFQAQQQASAIITALSNVFSSTKQAPPGTNSAIALVTSAQAQLSLGQAAYQSGDFNTAQTDFQNALNDANTAQNSLATTGGGTDTANLTSIWLVTVAGLMGGTGALLVGLAGFNYLRKRAAVLKQGPREWEQTQVQTPTKRSDASNP